MLRRFLSYAIFSGDISFYKTWKNGSVRRDLGPTKKASLKHAPSQKSKFGNKLGVMYGPPRRLYKEIRCWVVEKPVFYCKIHELISPILCFLMFQRFISELWLILIQVLFFMMKYFHAYIVNNIERALIFCWKRLFILWISLQLIRQILFNLFHSKKYNNCFAIHFLCRPCFKLHKSY